MVPPVWMMRIYLHMMSAYLAVVLLHAGEALAVGGHLDLLVELEFAEDVTALPLLISSAPGHLLSLITSKRETIKADASK